MPKYIHKAVHFQANKSLLLCAYAVKCIRSWPRRKHSI